VKIAFKTFGCRLNRAEALDMEARLSAAGHSLVPISRDCAVHSAESPDVIIVRGCSVTAKAQSDCEKEIARLRTNHPHSRIVVTGCLPGAQPLPQDFLGLADAQSNDLAPIPTSSSRAHLKVQDGCSRRCSFCIVPRFRSKSSSVPFADAMARARAFLAAGYREIVLTGCNLALYRSEGRGLPELLDAMASIQTEGTNSSGHRIRLGSIEPGTCAAETVDVMGRHANVCRFLHLSIQSGSDDVLKSMGRVYGSAEVRDIVERAAKSVGPGLALGADVITGFPGERECDFEATLALLARPLVDAPEPYRGMSFTNVHVFPYSERPGTPAADMPGAVKTATRRARAKIVSDEALKRRRRFAESFAGLDVEVCVEAGGDHGWTGEYLPVRLKRKRERRSLVRVHVSAVDGDTLHE